MLKFFVIIFVFINLISLSFSEVINKIDIKGNLRLDDNTIFSYINLNENSQILKSDLNTSATIMLPRGPSFLSLSTLSE